MARRLILIQLLILILIGAVLLPAGLRMYGQIESFGTDLRKRIIRSIESRYGVEIQFSSISPAFINSLKIHDLRVFSSGQPDRALVDLEHIEVRYRLKEILSGNNLDSIHSITGYNGIITLDIDNKIFESERSIDFPENITIPDISFRNVDTQIITDTGNFNLSGLALTITQEGEIDARTRLLAKGKGTNPFELKGELVFEGTYGKRQQDLQGNAIFKNLRTGGVHLKSLESTIHWNPSGFTMKNAPSFLPVAYRVEYRSNQNRLKAGIRFDGFTPSDIIADIEEPYRELISQRFYGQAEIDVDMDEKKTDYSFDVVIEGEQFPLDTNIVPGSYRLAAEGKGNSRSIDFERLAMTTWRKDTGNRGQAFYEGSFDLRYFVPEGNLTLRNFPIYPGGKEFVGSGLVHFFRKSETSRNIQLASDKLSINAARLYNVQAVYGPGREASRLSISFRGGEKERSSINGIFRSDPQLVDRISGNLNSIPLQTLYGLLPQDMRSLRTPLAFGQSLVFGGSYDLFLYQDEFRLFSPESRITDSNNRNNQTV
ncbi:MAG: hypothetical protein K9L68_03685, partial [Spirochaetales bacterium]|nr:hypothetical protein [Spirochaetales bacterium]